MIKDYIILMLQIKLDQVSLVHIRVPTIFTILKCNAHSVERSVYASESIV